MSDFYKKFLVEDSRRLIPGAGRSIFLGAFGKHPGWDDHVEDLGLESESLNIAKQLLYVQGIGGQIDAGAWEKLEAAQLLLAFKHLLLWQRGGQFLLGRLWSSSDGKGRARYPMIVCVHCLGLPLPWALSQVLPVLEEIEQALLLTKSADDVRSILSRFRSTLRLAAHGCAETDLKETALSADTLTRFVSHSDLGPHQEGLFRILYQIHSQMSAFAPGKFGVKGDPSSIRPQQIRLPACGDGPARTIQLWSRFIRSRIDPAAPMLLTLPLDETWLDITLGEVTKEELFSLRASPKKLPLANQVPYQLDDDFKERAKMFVSAFQNAETQFVPLDSGGTKTPTSLGPRPPGTAEPKTSSLKKWLFGGSGLFV